LELMRIEHKQQSSININIHINVDKQY